MGITSQNKPWNSTNQSFGLEDMAKTVINVKLFTTMPDASMQYNHFVTVLRFKTECQYSVWNISLEVYLFVCSLAVYIYLCTNCI
jgi:hypothetical protein